MFYINVVNGLVYGSLLMIVASGLALIYGLRRVVNFAHGALFMLGAYIGYSVALYTNFWIALVAAFAVMFVVGALLDKYGINLLQDRDPLIVILSTFGLLLIIEDVVQTVWGKGSHLFAAPDLLSGSIDILGMTLPVYRVAVVVFGLLISAALVFWLHYTRIGLYVRAASTDPVTTGMQGINTDRLSATVVGIGTGLAGVAGVITAPFLSLSPAMDGQVLIDSFMVVVIGGLGSLPGALAAALVLGQVQTLGSVYVPTIASALPFVLMIGVLIWKPEGIAGNRT